MFQKPSRTPKSVAKFGQAKLRRLRQKLQLRRSRADKNIQQEPEPDALDVQPLTSEPAPSAEGSTEFMDKEYPPVANDGAIPETVPAQKKIRY